ncbi:MAG: aminoacetone oxidase family FAD-binding enzyme [Clostridia bacterium]|nr:aminoacetone oxidase family FAD-binding enzyme [Clostridia bacterium]
MATDIIIIGGGAAGLLSAVYLKKQNPQLNIRILEALPRVGKKLLLTGNGRCNITNKNINLSRYHGSDVSFAEYALNKYDLYFTANFFESIGVPFVFEGEKAYPASLQAGSVVDCLRFSAEESGVLIHTDTKVTNIQTLKGKYRVWADKLSFVCDTVIVATGLYSGGYKVGSDGNMFELLKKAGFKTVNVTPAIVQLKTENDVVKQLKGIKVDANAALKAGERVIRQEFGEVLFCDYGLSGPPIMQLSREVPRNKNSMVLSLDMMPQIPFNDLKAQIVKRAENLSQRPLEEFFTGMLQKRVGQVILKQCGLKLSEKAGTLTVSDIDHIVKTIKSFDFKVLDTTGFINSQVSAGGISTTEFDNTTMQSKNYEKFYVVGEILDIDGDCGGFNLQWAWSSAFCACDHILRNK